MSLRGSGTASLAVAALLLAAPFGCSRQQPPTPDPVSHDAGAPSGGEPESYSAVVARTVERGGERSESETIVARRGDWRREEWTENGRRFACIVRPDLGRTFLVDVDRGVLVEGSLGPPAPDALGGDEVEALVAGRGADAAVTRERSGSETVGGHPCTIYRSHLVAPGGGASDSTVWEADDLGGLALRSELRGPDGSLVVTELRDLRVPADDALFEPPPAARRIPSIEAP